MAYNDPNVDEMPNAQLVATLKTASETHADDSIALSILLLIAANRIEKLAKLISVKNDG